MFIGILIERKLSIFSLKFHFLFVWDIYSYVFWLKLTQSTNDKTFYNYDAQFSEW
jgi:hypothetical protein